jgi:hypothetical protein
MGGIFRLKKAYRDIRIMDRMKNFIIGLKGSLDRIQGYPEWKQEARHLLDQAISQF